MPVAQSRAWTGSAQIVAEQAGIKTQPILVVVAAPAPGVILVDDDQVVVDVAALEPADAPSFDSLYRVTLRTALSVEDPFLQSVVAIAGEAIETAPRSQRDNRRLQTGSTRRASARPRRRRAVRPVHRRGRDPGRRRRHLRRDPDRHVVDLHAKSGRHGPRRHVGIRGCPELGPGSRRRAPCGGGPCPSPERAADGRGAVRIRPVHLEVQGRGAGPPDRAVGATGGLHRAQPEPRHRLGQRRPAPIRGQRRDQGLAHGRRGSHCLV